MKELILRVTADDCRFDYFVGSGNGGQAKQKTHSACRCTHKASGAVGTSQESRSQLDNRRLAFKRMAETEVFKKWHKIEVAKAIARLDGKPVQRPIEDVVEDEMKKVRVEVKNEQGQWEDETK